jgi:hypothetical protein
MTFEPYLPQPLLSDQCDSPPGGVGDVGALVFAAYFYKLRGRFSPKVKKLIHYLVGK